VVGGGLLCLTGDLLQGKQIAVGKREKGREGFSKFLYAFIEEVSQLESFCKLDLLVRK